MKYILITSMIFSSLFGLSQQLDKETYNKAIGYLWHNVHQKKAFNMYISYRELKDGSGFWYKSSNPKGWRYLKVDYKTGKSTPLFNHSELATSINQNTNVRMHMDSIDIIDIRIISKTEIQFTIPSKKKPYKYNPKTKVLVSFEREKADKPKWDEEYNSDKSKVFYSKDHNVYIKDVKSGKEMQVTTDGTEMYDYASSFGWADLIKGEGMDRPKRFHAYWSNDDKWVYSTICDMRSAEKMYLLDWSQDDKYRPQLRSYFRGSPGDTTMIHEIPFFVNAESGKVVIPKLPRLTHINSAEIEESEIPNQCYFLYQSRGFQDYIIVHYDVEKDELTEVYKETSTTNIDDFSWWKIPGKEAMLIISERSGWKQLYRLDLKTKELKAITKGEFFITEIVGFKPKQKKIFFTAQGVEKGENPYYQKLYSVNFDGSEMKCITPENVYHNVTSVADGDYFMIFSSDVNTPTKGQLMDAKTGKLTTFYQTELNNLNHQKVLIEKTANRFGGNEKIYTAIWRPSNFDPNKKYPVIDHSYTGPHTHMFPQSFTSGYWWEGQALAELGFIVVTISSEGGAERSKAFRDHSYRKLGSNLEGHIHVIRELSKKYAWIDTNRVGIYGHSAGGYDAGHALLAYPDFYKVGVASSADHDHRMEKAWWPEMYMGWPVDTHYHEQSNITMAGNLKGKLLLVHGGMDENVNPSATFKLAEALVNADKEFDLLIFPSQHHGYRGKSKVYFKKKRWNYFIEHLLGKEPIWKLDWNQ